MAEKHRARFYTRHYTMADGVQGNTNGKDPYEALTQLMLRLKRPLQNLLAAHDEFVLQNVTTLNHIKSMRVVRKVMEAEKR